VVREIWPGGNIAGEIVARELAREMWPERNVEFTMGCVRNTPGNWGTVSGRCFKRAISHSLSIIR
jgi:hypothetical protein